MAEEKQKSDNIATDNTRIYQHNIEHCMMFEKGGIEVHEYYEIMS